MENGHSIAEALKQADWSNVSLGNKALIQAAIEQLKVDNAQLSTACEREHELRAQLQAAAEPSDFRCEDGELQTLLNLAADISAGLGNHDDAMLFMDLISSIQGRLNPAPAVAPTCCGSCPAGCAADAAAQPVADERTPKQRREFLDLAEKNGARITGKPDGSEPIEIVFSISAWRAFDAALSLSPVEQPGQVVVDSKRLDFMLTKFRKVVVERLPHDNYEVYVEEGFMGGVLYPAVNYSGGWNSSSPEAYEIMREAIDAAMLASAQPQGGEA